MITKHAGSHTEAMQEPEKKGVVQYRSHCLEIKNGSKFSDSHRVVVDLEIPADEILSSVHFSSALFTHAMVRGILKEALAESKEGKSPRQWVFEVVCIRIDDPHYEELRILQSIEKEIQKGNGPVSEVQSLESFLNPVQLSQYLSVELSNKKLSTLSPVEIIFFAYVNRISSLNAYLPSMSFDHVIKYGSLHSASFETLKKCVPWISFPSKTRKLINAKARIDGHLLCDTEQRVRRDPNSYFVYKIQDSFLS